MDSSSSKRIDGGSLSLSNFGMQTSTDLNIGINISSNAPKYDMQKIVSFKSSKNLTTTSSHANTYNLIGNQSSYSYPIFKRWNLAIIEGRGNERGQIGSFYISLI